MQKKVFVYLLACALPLLPACVRETPEQEEESISPITGEGSEEGRLDGTAVKWRGTDKIAVIDNTSPYVHVFDNTDVGGGARCRFVGEAGDAASWPVVYPYSAFTRKGTDKFYVTFPAVQTAVTDGFANDSYITGVVATGKSFTMTPLCSMIKFTLAYKNIKQIFIEANLNSTFTGTVRPLAGTFIVDVNHLDPDDIKTGDDHPEYSSGRSGITLNPPTGETTFPVGAYYVPIADFTSRYGNVVNMRLTFTRQDDQTASRSKTGANFSFERGKYTDFGTEAVDEGLSWEYYDIVFAVPGLDDHTTATNLRWPFASWKTSDDGSPWTEKADPSANLQSLRSSLAWDIEGKLKDSGHTLRLHSVAAGGTGTKTEKLRYAENANGLYLSGHVGSYIEFPAMPNRHLLRVIVDYDGTSTEGGSPYMKGYSAAACPHITTVAGVNADYTLTRDADGFCHDYNLYSTADNTAYRYVISHDLGTDWSGPRIQRIRLYYSKESRSLTLPEPTLSVISTTLRRYENTLTLTGADGAYDMGIVVRHALETADPDAPKGHSYDRVIPVPVTPTVVGTTQTYVWENSLPWSKMRDEDELSGGDPGLTEENEVYAYVRKFGCTTDPRTMNPTESLGDSGDGWCTSVLTKIQRPSYDWSGTSSDLNYVYSSDTQVKLSATFTVTAGATQAYDYGFIYKTDAAADEPGNWNYTKLDQCGATKDEISGYTLASGANQSISATLTGLTPGTTYVYRPIVVQHMACKFDDGTSGESSETKDYKYVARASTGSQVTLAGPVVTVTTAPEAHYFSASTGHVTKTAYMSVAHLDPALYNVGRFTSGYLYGAAGKIRTRTDSKKIGDSQGETFPTTGIFTGVLAYNTQHIYDGSGYSSSPLTGLPDEDYASVNYRPYFAFVDGSGNEGVAYPASGDGYTLTCPVPSASGGDYLWQGATSADLKGTIAVTDANCKLEIGYSTDGGSTWTGITQDLAAGTQTISAATLAAEGPQTVKFGVRRSGSSDASTWKSLDIELEHPFSMVTTYSSSWYDNRTTATIAGSFTTNKVASNNLVEYGFYYTEINGTAHTSTIYTAPSNAQDYYTINITDGVSTAVSRDKRLVGWFFARLVGSSSVPTSHWTTEDSARSGKQMMTHTWADNLGYAKRLYVNFNTNPRSVNSSATNPFLPMNNVNYIDDLSVTYATLCQDKKARVVSGEEDLDIEFHLTHGVSTAAAHAVLSGACRNESGKGRMRVYAATKDDYILLPCPSDVKIARVVAWMWAKYLNTYWDPEEASAHTYAFFTSNQDSPAYVGPSYHTIYTTEDEFQDEVASWEASLKEANYSYSTYHGQPLRLHFCGQSVSLKTPYANITTNPDRSEIEIPGFWIDYCTDPSAP